MITMSVFNIPVVDPTAAKVVEGFPFHNAACIDGKLLGALWVLSQIRGVLPLVHGPVGCSWQRKCALMGPIVHYCLPCTHFSEFEVVYGGESKLVEGLVLAYKRYRPDMIVVLTTCASDMIGDDVESAIAQAKERGVRCPIVYSTGSAVGKMRQVGSQDVLLSIVKQYVIPETESMDIEEKTVNLMVIGGEYGIGIRTELAELLKRCGAKVNKVYFTDVSVRDLLDLARAEMNIVPYTQVWANYLYQTRSIKVHVLCRFEESDFTSAYPVGVEACKKHLVEIADKLGLATDPEKVFYEFYSRDLELLDKVRGKLQGRRVVLENPWGPEILLALELGLRIVGLIFWTQQFKGHGVSDSAVNEMIRQTTNFLQSVTDEGIEVMIDEPLERVIEKVKKINPDIVLCGWWSRIYEYDRHGIRTLSLRRFHLFFDYSIRQLVKAGQTLVKILEDDDYVSLRPLVPRTRSSLVDVQHIPEPFDKLTKLFYLNRYVCSA